ARPTMTRSSRGARGRCALLAVAAVTAAEVRVACADHPSASDAAAAEALFHEGRKLLADGNVSAACPKFAESYRLDPAIGSLLNLAMCHEREGRTASAWSEFREAEAQAASLGDTARRQLAATHAAALEPAMPHVRISADRSTTGLVVS